jgi:inorganic pyrophosphatase
MDVSKIAAGRDVPHDINVVVEIPQGSGVKYEIDKESGALVVDRVVFTAMTYPTAYGFIPNTLADDGDPADALVLLPVAVTKPARMKKSSASRMTRCIRNSRTSPKSPSCRRSRATPSSISSSIIRTSRKANGSK